MNSASIARRLRHMRRQRGLSLAGLEAKTGLTKSYLSKVERGITTPSIATIIKLAQAFSVPVGQLFGETADENDICLVRKDQRKTVVRRASEAGYHYEAIAHKRKSKCMEAFIMRPPVHVDERTLFEHEGEELIFVLRGRVEVLFADRRLVLEPGDCLYFDAHLLHRSRSIGSKSAETLVVIGGVGLGAGLSGLLPAGDAAGRARALRRTRASADEGKRPPGS
jgi:transcriptional regulator with XRE-family HTH domain